eukprot:633245-Alexandrium_andersonii.AAC.1
MDKLMLVVATREASPRTPDSSALGAQPSVAGVAFGGGEAGAQQADAPAAALLGVAPPVAAAVAPVAELLGVGPHVEAPVAKMINQNAC